MSATLKILNSLSVEIRGRTLAAWQGDADAAVSNEAEVTIDGKVADVDGSLATASGVTVWDDDDDVPTGFDYLWFKADQNCFIQLIGQTVQLSLPVLADVPFVLPTGQILAAVNTTPLAAVPTLEDIDSVRIWNESGNTMNFRLVLLD